MVPCSHLLKLGQSVSATVKRNLQAAIAALPQIKAIDPADAAAWIETALERHGSDPARLDWMVRRLGGLGPSDTAALQAEKAGRDVGRGIHEIVSEKLLKRFPAAASDDVVRLERAKPTLQAQLRSVLPTAVQQPAMHRLFEAGGAPKHPWLVGAPGDILAVKKAIVLVDYRAPSQKTVDEYRESGLRPRSRLGCITIRCSAKPWAFPSPSGRSPSSIRISGRLTSISSSATRWPATRLKTWPLMPGEITS